KVIRHLKKPFVKNIRTCLIARDSAGRIVGAELLLKPERFEEKGNIVKGIDVISMSHEGNSTRADLKTFVLQWMVTNGCPKYGSLIEMEDTASVLALKTAASRFRTVVKRFHSMGVVIWHVVDLASQLVHPASHPLPRPRRSREEKVNNK